MRIAMIFLLAAAGCGAVPHATTPQAVIRFDAAEGARCGPDSGPICEARVIRVDGQRVFAADALALEPGPRRLDVYCRFNLSIMIGDSQSTERVLVATLAPSGRYRIAARMSPRPCSVALIEDASGRVVAASD